MKGYVGEACLYGIHGKVTKRDERQLFGDDGETLGTVVAVATESSRRVGEATHESYPELGVPQEMLDEFVEVRDSLDIEDPVRRHNTAVKRINLKERYADYIEEDDEAQERVKELARRVADGEEITLMCVEERPMWCHRYHLRDRIEAIAEKLSK